MSTQTNFIKTTYDNLYNLYGNSLPTLIEERLQQEFTWIEQNEAEHFFTISKRFIDDMRAEGLVNGFRGTIGSSLVAYALGITRVNPLPAHYYCPNCHRVEFVDNYQLIGMDLPDKDCPACNVSMQRDGFNLPEEMLFGNRGEFFQGITLNVVHGWKERVRDLLETMDDIPKEIVEELDAQESFYIMESYSVIPHDETTLLNELTKRTGIHLKDEDVCKKELLELLVKDPMGIRSFDHPYAHDVIEEVGLHSFADAIYMQALLHSTSGWIDNAERLIYEKDMELKDVVSNRDDIMLYLMSLGMERESACKIATNVRKGKGLTLQEEQQMLDVGVEPWYIHSCKMVRYLFPKSHVVSYLMNDLRLAYYKLYHTQMFLDTYFQVVVPDMVEEIKQGGVQYIRRKLVELEMEEPCSDNWTEKEEHRALRLAISFYKKGYSLS